MTQTASTLEYRKAPQAVRTRSGRVAAGYFVGLIAGSVGLMVVGSYFGGGKSDPEADAYLPVIIAIGVLMMAASAICMWRDVALGADHAAGGART